MDKKHTIHFIGIGGVGMSGLAVAARSAGHTVTGSDIKASTTTLTLEKQGIRVFVPHRAENILEADLVVYSSAIQPQNPEFDAARRTGKTLLHRSNFLANLLVGKKPICVSGTHGKTTTTALVSHILTESGWDPTCFIGGTHTLWNSNVRLGTSPFVVTEADESDASLLNYRPHAALVTNIDDDHLDFYGNIHNLTRTFHDWLAQVQDDGLRVVCGDDENLYKLSLDWPGDCITYGFGERNLFRIGQVTPMGTRTGFDVYFRELFLGHLVTRLLGQHNLLNSLAAAVTTLALGVTFKNILPSLESFTGVRRRAEIIFKNETFTLMDDYAHHPTAVDLVLQTLKSRVPGRLVVIFQPHRYTRTRILFKNFAHSLCHADRIFLCPIYSADEAPIEGVDSSLILDSIPLAHRRKVKYLTNLDQAHLLIDQEIQLNDTVISIGAGNVREVVEKLARHHSGDRLPRAVSTP